MNLIFHNGEMLYKTEKQHVADVLNNLNIYEYQKRVITAYLDTSESDYKIYGDDFIIDMVSKNIEGNCVLRLSDYDEKQELEESISIDFTKDELSQFINLLQIVRGKM